jgi:hypothetical protein
VAAVAAALAGATVVTALLVSLRSSPLPEGRAVLAEALRRPAGAPAPRS